MAGGTTYPNFAPPQAISASLTIGGSTLFNGREPRRFQMPTYTYETIPKKKGQKPRTFEVVQSMKDPPLKKHPETGEPCKRIITGGCGVVFHGPSIMSMNVPRSRK